MPRVRIGSALPDQKKIDCRATASPSPAPASPISLLAYRLQANRFGDLDAESKHLLDRSESLEKAGQQAVRLVRRISDVRPGTVLGREWNGRTSSSAINQNATALLPTVTNTREAPGFHNPAGGPCRASQPRASGIE